MSFASGEKAKARDLVAAIRTLKTIEREGRAVADDEKDVLRRFAGFGPVALSIFPNPATGKYKDDGWEALGKELQELLTPEEYASAKRTTFNAFYTSPTVIEAIHEAIGRLGVPDDAHILEPGCGTGNFLSYGAAGHRYVGVELDRISGRIARALHPDDDVRLENFRDTRLAENSLDAVIGNVPFADLKLDYQGQRLALHDYFFAKSVDALRPGGVLALVTSHFTLDKQNAALREQLAAKADFLGAIRLPSNAFQREGTSVVADVVFLRKRATEEPPRHVDPDWLRVAPLTIDGVDVTVNRYFLNHPETVLGDWSRDDTLYREGYSVIGQGDLAEQLRAAVARLPKFGTSRPASVDDEFAFDPPPPERRLSEGSFTVGDDGAIRQVVDGREEPVVYGGRTLHARGTMTGKRLAALVGLRNRPAASSSRRTRNGPTRSAPMRGAGSTWNTTGSPLATARSTRRRLAKRPTAASSAGRRTS